MESKQNLVFVGAGPSNLVAIMYLLYNKYSGNITLIDKGKDIYSRKENELLHGMGGAGTFSDAKNVFSKHKDQPIFDFIDDTEDYYNFNKQIIKDFHPNPELINISEPEELPDNLKNTGVKDAFAAGWGKMAIKQSTTWHVGSTNGKIILRNWQDYMKSNGVNMYFENTFKGIGNSHVITDKEKIKYDKLFLALGKVGKKDLINFYKKHNIESQVQDMNLGIRFEIDYDNNKNIQEIVSKQYDFKFSKDINKNKNIRTFCSCHGAAQVVAEKFDNTIRVNGHGYGLHMKEKWTGTSNFGIMINEKVDGDNIIKNIISKYPNGFMVKYNDNFNETMEDNIPQISIEEFLKLYNEYGDNILDFIESLQNILKFDGYRFYGPEIKESSSRVKLTKDLEIIGLKNVYSIGDSGIGTRGIIPAACSGIRAVEHLIKDIK